MLRTSLPSSELFTKECDVSYWISMQSCRNRILCRFQINYEAPNYANKIKTQLRVNCKVYSHEGKWPRNAVASRTK